MDNKCVVVYFVVTYYPHLKNISKIIKHIKHLYASPEVRRVFTPLPFVTFFLFCTKSKDSFDEM